jgi:hypothetical protein
MYKPNSRLTQLFIKQIHKWRQHVSALISEPSSGKGKGHTITGHQAPRGEVEV